MGWGIKTGSVDAWKIVWVGMRWYVKRNVNRGGRASIEEREWQGSDELKEEVEIRS